MPRPSTIEIDLHALSHNARLVRALAGPARVMAAVKADAYGHGALPCSQTLAPLVDGLAVAHVEEALNLRLGGITAPVLVLEGPFDGEDVAAIAHNGFSSVIHSLDQLELVVRHGLNPDCGIWLKVDTGMHRLGLALDEIDLALQKLESLNHRELVLMSHLAMAEVPETILTQRQLDRWSRVTAARVTTTSLMNSAGLVGRLQGESDWVRPGYMLYGGKPGPHFDSVPLAPVMHFCSAIMAVRSIASGETVGYGGRWQANRDSRIATIPVGYGDGYPRTASNGTPVWIDGVLCPLVGRVSMDMITVDVTDHPQLNVGAPVELWGRHLSVDTVAHHAATIGYELLTRMPARIQRRWINANPAEATG